TRELNKKSGGEPAYKAKEYSKKTLRWGVGAMVGLVGFIILIILLLGLLSYLLTFIN
ncbi:transmembrane protein 265 isoform X1, partial [Tachysurus ichikawai]